MSKSFQVPFEPIVVKPWAALLEENPEAKPEPLSFRKFSTFIWLDDARAITDDAGKQSVVKLRRWLAVVAKFERAKPGDWITLEDEDYATLKKIVEAPIRSFQGTSAAMACLPYTDLVLSAVDKIPLTLLQLNGKESETHTE
jgi:hypothetical protein